MLHIGQAKTDDEIRAARELFLEYQQWLKIDLSFQDFETEVASLPGSYAPPAGRLLLARVDDAVAGCIALQPRGQGECEMKRLYVRGEHHGIGLGRLLVTSVIDEARRIGYRRIVLDTLPVMKAAHHLYLSFGFSEIPAYRYNPVQGTRYLALDL
jgi:GNAT superfamily N-acetyltransferase